VQKLTVREAAGNLGISEDAVRKRIQRGTLAHHRSSDGHVYVYMDNHAGAQQETSVEEISATSQDSRSSWWDYAAGASALLLITSGLIYVLGLFTLWTPIAMTDTDYLTAWHAASLVPKTVVAGLGVQQLVAFPLLAGTLVFIILFYFPKLGGQLWGKLLASGLLYLLVLVFCVWRVATGTSSSLSKLGYSEISQIVLWFLLLNSFVIILVLVVVVRYRTSTWSAHFIFTCASLGFAAIVIYFSVVRDVASYAGIDYLIDAAIIVGAGTIVWLGAAYGVEGSTEMFSAPWLSWLPRRGLQPYFVVLATAFVAAFMLTIPSRPALPSVEIDVKGRDKGAVNGKLLTHTDGFWYVFQPQESRVTAVPDDEVMRVWVSKANQ